MPSALRTSFDKRDALGALAYLRKCVVRYMRMFPQTCVDNPRWRIKAIAELFCEKHFAQPQLIHIWQGCYNPLSIRYDEIGEFMELIGDGFDKLIDTFMQPKTDDRLVMIQSKLYWVSNNIRKVLYVIWDVAADNEIDNYISNNRYKCYGASFPETVECWSIEHEFYKASAREHWSKLEQRRFEASFQNNLRKVQ